jgi:hypothetical protein
MVLPLVLPPGSKQINIPHRYLKTISIKLPGLSLFSFWVNFDRYGAISLMSSLCIPEMGSSEPLPIVDSDKRRKKKRKTRATDSLPGKFEGWCHTLMGAEPECCRRGEASLISIGPDARTPPLEPGHPCD